MTPAARALTVLVHAYRYGVRPLIGPNCRFHPHCSDYALDALRAHGAGRGAWLAGRRVLRCHPWNPGGYDPVPPTPPRRRPGAADAAAHDAARETA